MTERIRDSQVQITSNQHYVRWLVHLAGLALTLAVPVLLPLMAVRLVMTPAFLQLEYQRPGFPVDFYGFSTQDRLHFAPYALDYLLNDAGIVYLGDLTFADGSPLYTTSELEHMEDVKVVTRAAFFVLMIGSAAVMLLAIGMLRHPTLKRDFWQGIFNGGVLTIGILIMIVLGAVFAWDFFFTTFHRVFFQEGTWVFLYSDTLIRLFPEQFWFDAALTIGILSVSSALGLIALAGTQLKRG